MVADGLLNTLRIALRIETLHFNKYKKKFSICFFLSFIFFIFFLFFENTFIRQVFNHQVRQISRQAFRQLLLLDMEFCARKEAQLERGGFGKRMVRVAR